MSPVFDSDPLLRRLEQRALTFCAAAATVALLARGGRPDVALGIVAGGLLSAVSYGAIRSGVTALTRLVAEGALRAATPPPGSHAAAPAAVDPSTQPADSASVGAPSKVALLLRLTGRYALLGLMAYGMIARLRLHPIGLLIGMSSLVVAASLEAVRSAMGRREI